MTEPEHVPELRYIITRHNYRKHKTLEEAQAELVRLAAETGKGSYRILCIQREAPRLCAEVESTVSLRGETE